MFSTGVTTRASLTLFKSFNILRPGGRAPRCARFPGRGRLPSWLSTARKRARMRLQAHKHKTTAGTRQQLDAMLSAGYAPPGLRPGLLPQRGATASPPARRRIATWRDDTQRKHDGRNGLSVKVFPGLGLKGQPSRRNRRRADTKIRPQDRIRATRGDFSLVAKASGGE